MKKLFIILGLSISILVGASDAHAKEVQGNELEETSITCKNGTFSALKNKTDHAIKYEFLGSVEVGGVNILSAGNYTLLPGQTVATNKRIGFSY